MEENQARRLLNDIASYRAYLEQQRGHPVSEMVAASQWLGDVYDPVIAAIPEDLRGRLPPAEIFHEILEHRWYMSEAAGTSTWGRPRPPGPTSRRCCRGCRNCSAMTARHEDAEMLS